MKKALACLLLTAAALLVLAGCAAGSSAFNNNKEINVVSREDGSGTRGAFVELFGILVKGENGSRKDTTTKEAIITKQTDVMMINIAMDKYAIGYISLGSLNETVKALEIEGVAPSAENVKNGAYPISRPFVIATKDEISPLAQDFIDFILSAQGQEVVSKSYIAVRDDAPAYKGDRLAGKIVIAGSSSVTPIMEKLKEAYAAVNPNGKIEIQASDSTAGMTGVIDGTCDIGMSSRGLKDSELLLLKPTQIALDGVVVIVNKENPATSLSREQVKNIFTGKITKWSEVNHES